MSQGASRHVNYQSISDARVFPLETTSEEASPLKPDYGSKMYSLQFWIRAAAWTTFASFLGLALYRSYHRGVFEYMDSGTPLLGARSNSVRVYQTSMGSSERMALLTENSLKNMGIEVTKIAFGNAFVCPDARSGAAATAPQCDDGEASVLTIDASTMYQTIIGFGGAFTEAAAINYANLSSDLQDALMEMYFGPTGIGYRLGRIHINSCDFSDESYTYDPIKNDFNLDHFDMTVEHDQAAVLPFIRAAIERIGPDGALKLLASPWSPPAWMKVPVAVTNDKGVTELVQSMLGSAQPSGLIQTPKVQKAWAKYISRFIEAYNQQGVPIWAITPQNEPEFAAPWEACAYTPSSERDFIGDYLGPELQSEHPEVLILAFDHNKDHLEVWADTIMGLNQSAIEISGNFPHIKLKGTIPPPIPSKSAQYVDGMAFHWYSGSGDRNMDGTYGYDALRSVHEKFPEKILLATEACSCPGVAIGNWMRAERTGHDVMYDLNNFAQGWIDWNLIVNSLGGPNHLKNFCDAPIVTFENFTGFHVQPKFFYLGHFSKFIKPEAVRIEAEIIGNFNNMLDNPNLQSGVEVGVYLCEQSSRQMWVLRESGQIQLASASTYDHEPVGVLGDESVHELCLAPGDDTRPFVRVRNCDGVDSEQKAFRFMAVASNLPNTPGSKPKKDVRSASALPSTKNAGYSQLQLVQDGHSEPKCLSIHKTSDQFASGDVLSLKKCDAGSVAQLWYVPSGSESGAIRPVIYDAPSAAPAPTCLTAGWPFLSATAALNPDGSKAIVVMNESPRSGAFTVSDPDRGTLSLGIAGRSIQTITY